MEGAAHLIGPIPENQEGQIDLPFLAMMSDGERRGKLDQGFYSMGVTIMDISDIQSHQKAVLSAIIRVISNSKGTQSVSENRIVDTASLAPQLAFPR